jgi:hypothetical protein
MSDAMREAFEKWYVDTLDDDASFVRFESSKEKYNSPYVQLGWEAYKAGASSTILVAGIITAANARIAELEARCPVSCAKRGTPP